MKKEMPEKTKIQNMWSRFSKKASILSGAPFVDFIDTKIMFTQPTMSYIVKSINKIKIQLF